LQRRKKDIEKCRIGIFLGGAQGILHVNRSDDSSSEGSRRHLSESASWVPSPANVAAKPRRSQT
jgi:hypothetical protein